MRQLLLTTAALFGALSCDTVTEPMFQDQDGDGIEDAVDACPTLAENINNVFDRDGCPDTPADLYNAVRADVEQFWSGAFFASGATYTPIFGFTFYNGTFNTPCGPRMYGASYCQGQTFFEETFMLEQLQLIGDMAPGTIIAHEIGHHVSNLSNFIPGVNVSVKQFELQADCFAGAWASTVANRGFLETADLQEAAASLVSASRPDITWFDPTLHGTAQQRIFAFGSGFQSGALICIDPGWLGQFP